MVCADHLGEQNFETKVNKLFNTKKGTRILLTCGYTSGKGRFMANILVIDDESHLLDLVAMVLRRDSHVVTAVSDPIAALKSLHDGAANFDLILTDVSMSPVNGFEFARRLVHLGIDCPMIFMSGYGSAAGAFDSVDTDRVLEKPFTSAALRGVVGRSLARNSRAKAARISSNSI
jgi:DNA-binding NtrC family response regulator